jgi:ribokinase
MTTLPRSTPSAAAELRARPRFNPAPAGVDRSVFAFADVLTLNELELGTIAATEAATGLSSVADGPRPASAAGQLLETVGGEPGVDRAVVVTRGARGAMLVSARAAPVEIPARRVEAIDAVGAGDTFAGALAAGIAVGLPLEDAVRRAVLAASLSTTKPGARGGMPTAAEVEAALQQG